jgi:hypothetical protein
MSEDLVLLIRLDASQGFYNMADLMPIVSHLRKHGIKAVIEVPPGAPLEGASVHYIKVPEELLDLAKNTLQDYFLKDSQA